jgi:hypothetical protein
VQHADLWIGVAHVGEGDRDTLGGRPGGFVNAVSPAEDEMDFCRRVQRTLTDEGFEVREVTDVETLHARGKRELLDEDFLRLARAAYESGDVQLGTIYRYLADE